MPETNPSPSVKPVEPTPPSTGTPAEPPVRTQPNPDGKGETTHDSQGDEVVKDKDGKWVKKPVQ